jgi:integrase
LKTLDGSRCKTGTKEALCAYHRHALGMTEDEGDVSGHPRYSLPSGESDVTVAELAAGYLTYSKGRNMDKSTLRIILDDFLLALFGDEFLVDSFSPKCLKKVREAMIQSKRFNRETINHRISRIVTIFGWGVSEELVKETTHRALKTVKKLEEGHPGTWDNPPREDVPFDVVARLIPFLVPMLQAMVQIQWLQGMRPNEVCRMRVGQIDRSRKQKTGLWYYTPASHKTQKKTGKKTIFPLGKYEQELLLPYLEGKRAEAAVFSPAQAMKERYAMLRANRKTPIQPYELARSQERTEKYARFTEFYSPDTYRKAIVFGIAKANRQLPDGEKIPHWFPYQLRHSAITNISLERGKDMAQALAGHTSSKMTDNYDHSQLKKRERLAKKRKNPFKK